MHYDRGSINYFRTVNNRYYERLWFYSDVSDRMITSVMVTKAKMELE